MSVEFGVHLPLIDLDGRPSTLARLTAYTREAAGLGFRYLCANDHLVYRRPWLDGPTALAAVLEASGDMTIATTVTVPVLRGPAPTARLLTALSVLSGGRLVAGVGPGSSPDDFIAIGLDFAERWPRFDETVRVLRILLGKDAGPFHGRYYSAEDLDSWRQHPRPDPPPLWIASWGSPTGVRRVAELGDGWLASAYNTTPARFRHSLDQLEAAGRPAATFPNAISTMWLHVTDQPAAADHVIDHVLAPLLNRDPDTLRTQPLLIGSPEHCAEVVSAYATAGAQRILLWPIGNEIPQLEAFCARVQPIISTTQP